MLGFDTRNSNRSETTKRQLWFRWHFENHLRRPLPQFYALFGSLLDTSNSSLFRCLSNIFAKLTINLHMLQSYWSTAICVDNPGRRHGTWFSHHSWDAAIVRRERRQQSKICHAWCGIDLTCYHFSLSRNSNQSLELGRYRLHVSPLYGLPLVHY